MGKWEYIVEPWRNAITDVDSPDLEARLDELGQEGWELVNIIPQVGGYGGLGSSVSVNFNQMVFKRKVSKSTDEE